MFTRKKANDSALAKYQRIQAAIASELGKFPAMIQVREDAESALADATVAHSTGEGTPEQVDAARKGVVDARTTIDLAGQTLANLRSALASTGSQLAMERTAAAAELKEHQVRITAEFAQEWQKAVDAFSNLLGRRAALEALIRQRFDLPVPTPVAAELGDDVKRPFEQLSGITGALDVIAMSGREATSQREIDPHRTYVLVNSIGASLPAGTKVCAAMFSPGRLAYLIDLKIAIAARDPRAVRGVRDALSAKREAEIEAERERQERQARERQEAASRPGPVIDYKEATMFPHDPERRAEFLVRHPDPDQTAVFDPKA